jgi:Transglutaminase-like superfamily
MADVAAPPSSDSRSPLSAAPAGPKTSSIAALAIAVIGAAVMIDLAVETFIGGSALRWWAVAAAAAYLGVTVVARRMNIGWNSQVTIVIVFALGLVAATAWRPAGLTDGIRLAGQPTSRLLAGLTAAALIVAIVTILRATVFPLAVRLVVSLLALYGLAAFLLGAWQTTPYQALFAGDSIWRVLPRWLQGGVIGGLLALPLALLVALSGGLTRGKRTWQLQSIVTFALTLAIAFSTFRNGAQFDLSASGDAREAQTQPDPRTLADASTLIKRIADTPESSTFSIEKTADEIGNDPASLFAYVHDHVRTQIYSGVLRGARGTLMGGAGNSWDQALLLAAMLRHQGREVRFAHAHLTQDIAARIIDRMFTDAGRPTTPAGQSLQIPDSLQKGSRAKVAQIRADWQSARADLLQALDSAHLSLGDGATSEQTLESEAADHLFVEYHDGDRWVPLDPVATASPGSSVAPDGESFPEVPDAFYHHVTIRVQIEERHGQKLAQEEIFKFPTTAAALNGEQVVLLHKFDHDITGGWRATPVLEIGDQAYGARTFAQSGLIAAKANSKEDLIGQAHEAVGQLGKVTDVFSSGNAQSPSTPAAAEFTAESLEVEFVDPAQHSEIVRREMIDRIGPVARANNTAASAPLTPITIGNDVPLELAGIYALAFAAGPLNPTLPRHRLSSTQGLIEDAEALRHVQPSQNVSLSSEDQQRMGRVLKKFPVLLQTSAESTLALSQHVAQSLRVRGVPALFYESTPRLVIASFDLTSGLALDLRRNTLRAVARKVSASDLVRANVERSVADAVIEGDVLRLKAERRRIAAINIFDQARTQHIRLVTARSGTPLPVQASDLARARMASAEPGSLLIAPERTPSANPSHFAWWKLNPSTGEAISTLDTGLNGFQDLPEEAVIETRVVSPMAYTLYNPGLANTLPAFGIAQDIATAVVEALVELGEDIDLDLMGDFY